MSSPSAAILDSQSVKTGTMVRQSVGYDGGKRVKGRNRHLVVDTLGLMITVAVTAASVPEREGAKLVVAKLEQMREPFGRLV
jgi:putative transposase